MLIEHPSPAGIDAAITKIQRALHSQLSVLWGNAYKCYGRCYRNRNDNGYIAENYEGDGEYKEVYLDDTAPAISFFGVSSNVDTSGVMNVADIHLVFFVNLSKVKPTQSHRADEEVRIDVLKALGSFLFGASVTGVELWLENVLREYPGSRRDERLKAADMHPWHCFRVNMQVSYKNAAC